MKKILKGLLICAGLLLFTLTADTIYAADTDSLKLVASYDMSHEDGYLTDISGMDNHAEIVGFTESDFSEEQGEDVLVFSGDSNQYIKLPAGLIEKEAFAIEATFKADRAENSWLWCLGTKAQSVGSNYVFLSPIFGDGSLRAGIKNNSSEQLFSNSGQIGVGSWHRVRVEFQRGSMSLYVDDNLKSTLSTNESIVEILKNGSENDACGYIGKSLYLADPGFSGTLQQFDVYAELKGDAELLEDSLQELALPKEVWDHVELPKEWKNGGKIRWSSSNPKLISEDGSYSIPDTSTEVTLTANVTYGNETGKKEFVVIAVGKEDVLNCSNFMIPYTLKAGDTLPKDAAGYPISWSCETKELVTKDGSVTGPESGISQPQKVTAEITIDGKKFTAEYEMQFLGKDYQYLLGYTRDDSANGGYRVGNSLHLAYSADGTSYEGLNSNYGILFAAADYSKSVAGSTRTLKEPYVFRMKDGGFGVIAIRAYENNGTEAPGKILFFTSDDLISYKEHGLKEVHKGKDIYQPGCEYDVVADAYRIGWKDVQGTNYYCTTKDFKEFSQPVTGPVFEGDTVEYLSIESAIAENIIYVTKEEGLAVKNKLGRIVNTTVDNARIQIKPGEKLNLEDVRVTAHYNDGSTSEKRVKWNQKQIDAINTNEPGIYEVEGTIIQETYPFPMMDNRADPNILYYEGKYYFIATDSKYEKQFNLYIRCADTLKGLQDTALVSGSETKDVNDHLLWDGESSQIQDENGNWVTNPHQGIHWAPELHIIKDRLYCFFAMRPNNSAGYYEPQCYIARLKEEGDPLVASDWEEPVRVMAPDGEPLLEQTEGISLDMTYFEVDGTSYVCWSQRLFANGENPGLLIAETDPFEPWQLLSEPVRIASNDYGWEREGCNEGPYVIQNNGIVYMVFSANGVGPQYATGMLIAKEGDDLTDPDAWTKSNYPWMHNGVMPGQYGLGHNAFFQDEYGDWYNVYHAIDRNQYADRSSTLVPVHFRADGSPVLDMKPQEELLPANRKVTVTIQVGEQKALPYVDVKKDDWFYESVAYNYYENLMTGMDSTHFGPYNQLARAQFALILYRMEGLPKFTTTKSFGDITGNEWYGEAVLWAAEAGIVTGYQNGMFGPADNITREQMAVMMYRYAKYLGEDITTDNDISAFKDAASVSDFALDAIKWANSKGIITGKEYGTIIDPQGNTTRCEAATIIKRFMEN